MPHQTKFADLKIDYVHFNSYKTAQAFCMHEANARIDDVRIEDGQLVIDVKIIKII